MISNVTKPTSFGGVINYVAYKEEAVVLEVRGVSSLQRAADEMALVATQSRAEKPAYHVSIRLAPGDPKLSDEAWLGVVDRIEKRLGLTDRQRVVARHGDDHVHVVWNRVDVQTGKALRMSHDYRVHELELREVEQELGLRKVPGRHSWREAGTREPPNPRHEPKRAHWAQERQGHQPFAEVVRERVYPALSEAQGWDDLHSRLREHGLTLDPYRQGLVVSDGAERIGISRVYDPEQGQQPITRRALETRFGETYSDYAARTIYDDSHLARARTESQEGIADQTRGPSSGRVARMSPAERTEYTARRDSLAGKRAQERQRFLDSYRALVRAHDGEVKTSLDRAWKEERQRRGEENAALEKLSSLRGDNVAALVNDRSGRVQQVYRDVLEEARVALHARQGARWSQIRRELREQPAPSLREVAERAAAAGDAGAVRVLRGLNYRGGDHPIEAARQARLALLSEYDDARQALAEQRAEHARIAWLLERTTRAAEIGEALGELRLQRPPSSTAALRRFARRLDRPDAQARLGRLADAQDARWQALKAELATDRPPTWREYLAARSTGEEHLEHSPAASTSPPPGAGSSERQEKPVVTDRSHARLTREERLRLAVEAIRVAAEERRGQPGLTPGGPAAASPQNQAGTRTAQATAALRQHTYTNRAGVTGDVQRLDDLRTRILRGVQQIVGHRGADADKSVDERRTLVNSPLLRAAQRVAAHERADADKHVRERLPLNRDTRLALRAGQQGSQVAFEAADATAKVVAEVVTAVLEMI